MKIKFIAFALLIVLCGCATVGDKPPVAKAQRDSVTVEESQEKPPEGYAQKPTIGSSIIDAGEWLFDTLLDSMAYNPWVIK